MYIAFRRLLLAIALVILCIICMPEAKAGHHPEDITAQCKIEARTKSTSLASLFDGNPRTAWTSAERGEQYLLVYKPRGVATLSVLWAKAPKDLALRQYRGGEFKKLQTYAVAVALPDSFLLPEEAGVYYLCSAGGMSIAELRVHEGVLIDFFATNDYPEAPVGARNLDKFPVPLKRGVRGSEVLVMQERLNKLGYHPSKLDAYFNDETYLALLAYQRGNGLYANGVLDAETSKMLFAPQAPAEQNPAPKKMPRVASSLVNFFLSKVGSGYIYGTAGQICSPTTRAASRSLYPEYEQLLREFAPKWDGAEVYDCNGLFKAFLEASEGEFPKEWHTNVTNSAQRWMSDIQPISTMPKQPGIVLLQQSDTGSFSHVGLYVGDGYCVHSRGHRYGVVMDPMPQLWTHWARPTWLDFNIPEEPKANWPQYMTVGERVLVDTGTGNPLILYRSPAETPRYATGVRIPNYTEIVVKGVPTEAPYWRQVITTDSEGVTRTGYVNAKDLSVLDPPMVAKDRLKNAVADRYGQEATHD